MEKEFIKNRQVTELILIKAVDELIEEKGFEGLGINAVAAKAGVSKMLIYRYFNSLEGLIAAYIGNMIIGLTLTEHYRIKTTLVNSSKRCSGNKS